MVNLVHNPISRERMEQYQNRHLRQIEHAAKQWEARDSKVKSNHMRRKWLERQNNANYRNELNRITNEIAHRKLSGKPSTDWISEKKIYRSYFLQVTYI